MQCLRCGGRLKNAICARSLLMPIFTPNGASSASVHGPATTHTASASWTRPAPSTTPAARPPRFAILVTDVFGECDVIDESVVFALVQFGRGHNFSIDANALKHRNICTQPPRIAFVDDDGETRLDETASPAHDVAPIAEVMMALPGQLGFRRERIMHPDQRARPRRHPRANSVLVEHAHTSARARKVERERASDHTRADYDYVCAR